MNNHKKILLFYCLSLFLLFLGNVPLLDPDEPVYGETAKEMLAAGDWLSPRIYGEFWYDKPPLFYWLEAAFFSIFGISTFSARLPSALIAAATVLYTYSAARRLLDEKTAFLGALILASSLEFTVIARSSVTDMTLTAALTAALFSFLEKRYVLAYISCGAALLAKGPVGFGFPALIVAIWLIAQKRFTWKPIMALKWYWGIPLACVVGLPWYLYMTAVHGSAFVDTFLGYHNLTRFAQPEHAGQDHWWLYIVVLAAGCFPWSGAVFAMMSRLRAFCRDPVRLYLLVWAGFIFLFFSASSTQLFSYILPMFPPLSLLAALYLKEMTETGPSKVFAGTHIFFLLLTAGALAAAPLMPAGGLLVKYGFPVLLAASGLAGLWAWRRLRFSWFCTVQCALSFCVMAIVWTAYAPAVREDFTSMDLSAKVLTTERDERPLYIDPFYRPASAFYHDLYGQKMPDLEKGEAPINGPAYLLVQKKVWKDWPLQEKSQWHTIWEEKHSLFLEKS